MLTVHHLGRSQSERIVWLCEELGIPYRLKIHDRDPVTRLSPPALQQLHPLGAAPVITDTGDDGDELRLAESGAIIDYLIAVHGGGRLALKAGDAGFADYLYWYHFANSNLQALMGRNMIIRRLPVPADEPTVVATRGRLDRALKLLDDRLAKVDWLAGASFTAADIMIVFSLTTMRLFMPLELAPWPNILAYLQRVGARPAYQRAMATGDTGFAPMLS